MTYGRQHKVNVNERFMLMDQGWWRVNMSSIGPRDPRSPDGVIGYHMVRKRARVYEDGKIKRDGQSSQVER